MGGRRSPPRGHRRAIRRRGGHHIPSRNQASLHTAVAAGLALRYDGGSCFRSEHYQTEIDHLGITRSPAFHYEPETNGCAEKAIQTLKEQVLWIERFDTRGTPRCCARVRTPLQQALADRAASLPHTGRSARAPDPPGRRDMIASFTKVCPVNRARRRVRRARQVRSGRGCRRRVRARCGGFLSLVSERGEDR